MAHTRAAHVGALLHSGKSTPKLAMKALIYKSGASAVLVNVPAGTTPTQDQFNLAGAGGTISFAGASSSNFNKPIQLLPNQTVVGGTQIAVKTVADVTTMPGYSIPTPQYSYANETILDYPGGGLLFIPANGVTIKNVSPTTSLLRGTTDLNGITVSQCHFNMATVNPGHATAIESGNGAWLNTQIADCVFEDKQHIVDAFMYFYDLSGHLHNLACQGANDHIHISGTSSATSFTIEQVYSTDNAANAVEYQYFGQNSAIKDCWQDTPRYNCNPIPGTSHYLLLGYSCPNDDGRNLSISGTVVLANNQSNMANRQRLGFELAQPNVTLIDNYVNGVRKAVASNNAQTTGTVTGCYFEPDLPDMPPIDTNGGKIVYSDVANVGVKTGLLARGRPGAMFMLGSTTITPPPIVPAITPVPATLPSVPFTWASDLAYVAIVNGWGPIEKDQSNGEQGAGDGQGISLNNVSYTKGFGCHAASEIDLNLGGAYARFISDIGIDEEVGNAGNADFTILADGLKVYDSGAMTGGSATKTVSIDVTGKLKLQLITTPINAADNGFCHTDWAGAYLTPTPTPNAQIVALQAQLAAAQVQINALQAQVAVLTASNSTLSNTLAAIRKALGI